MATDMDRHPKVEQTLEKMAQWQVDHAKDDADAHQEISARFDVMESNISLLPTKHDIEKVVRETLIDVLFTTGRGTKFWLVTAATVIGALVIIGGGFKWLLGFIGFTYLK